MGLLDGKLCLFEYVLGVALYILDASVRGARDVFAIGSGWVWSGWGWKRHWVRRWQGRAGQGRARQGSVWRWAVEKARKY
jgi:hypothetical protein